VAGHAGDRERAVVTRRGHAGDRDLLADLEVVGGRRRHRHHVARLGRRREGGRVLDGAGRLAVVGQGEGARGEGAADGGGVVNQSQRGDVARAAEEVDGGARVAHQAGAGQRGRGARGRHGGEAGVDGGLAGGQGDGADRLARRGAHAVVGDEGESAAVEGQV